MFELAAARLEDPALAPPTRLQIVTFTSSAAYAAMLITQGIVPGVCLPHSMGLYAALVTSGACEFEPMLDFVVRTGQAIDAFSRSGDYDMVSVLGLDSEKVEGICRRIPDAYVGNYNSVGHTVVSGRREAVMAAIEEARRMDCYDTRPLGTGVPLHTPIMNAVRGQLLETLRGFSVSRPRLAVMCPYRTRLLRKGDIIPALADHIRMPVRFEQMVRAVAGTGVRAVLEVGYDRLLSRFVSWIDPGIRSRSVASSRALAREARRRQPIERVQ